jgi:predicted ATPase
MSNASVFHPITTDLIFEPTHNKFKVQTNWFVITGAACTGKTTLINMLAAQGSITYPETAREFFDSEIAAGRSLDAILADGKNTQHRILQLQLALEQGIPPDQTAFLDRGIPDSIPFYRIFGMDPNQIIPDCLFFRYRAVFLLDRLPLLREKPLGPEDDASSDFINEWLYKDYHALGYDVIRVPPISPEARLTFMLEQVDKYMD